MFCPTCHAEYNDGVATCADCDVSLIEELPRTIQIPETRPLVAIYQAIDEVHVLLVRSLLEDAGIEFFARNERLQDLFGYGRVGGYNFIVGPVTFEVLESEAEAAREVLCALDESNESVESNESNESNENDS
jgi:hypothetical protein